MSSLFVYAVTSPDVPDKVLNHLEDIAATLAEHGVQVERLPVAQRIMPGLDTGEVARACSVEIDSLMTERGLASVEVLSLNDDQPPATLGSLREEHSHAAAQVWWFVAGRGLLSLHLGDCVYRLWCEPQDLVSLPAGTRQWLDLGERPRAAVVRLFASPDGAIATLTGSGIAERFAGFDD